MFRTSNIARVTTAAVGALVLSTLSVTAAIGPGHLVQPAPTAFASVDSGTRAHG